MTQYRPCVYGIPEWLSAEKSETDEDEGQPCESIAMQDVTDSLCQPSSIKREPYTREYVDDAQAV